jgi:hypothetical protein
VFKRLVDRSRVKCRFRWRQSDVILASAVLLDPTITDKVVFASHARPDRQRGPRHEEVGRDPTSQGPRRSVEFSGSFTKIRYMSERQR